MGDKLLRAFIKASGHEVEEVKTTHTPKFSPLKAPITDRFNQQLPFTTIDYKVTKKLIDHVRLHEADVINKTLGQHIHVCFNDKSEYDYMQEIKQLIIESGIPKSVIIDMCNGLEDKL